MATKLQKQGWAQYAINSLLRGINNTKNPKIKEIYEHELVEMKRWQDQQTDDK